MNQTETVQLLTIVSSVDNRKVTDLSVAAWHEILAGVDYEAAREALRQFRQESPGVYLEPGHIYQIVRRNRVSAQSNDRGLARPPAPPGKRYAVDAIEQIRLEG